MWDTMALRRHRFLHVNHKEMNPSKMNRIVDLARGRPPCKHICFYSSCIPCALFLAEHFCPAIDRSKCNIAYGLWGIPKMLKQTNSDDLTLRVKALNMLTDQLRDPLKCIRAINDFAIVRRLEYVTHKIIDLEQSCAVTLERIMICFQIIATHYQGAQKILSQSTLIDFLYDTVKDKSPLSVQSATVLMLISEHPKIAHKLIKQKHLTRIAIILYGMISIKEIYVMLSNLTAYYPYAAYCVGFFDIILEKVTTHNWLQPIRMKIFALLISGNYAIEECENKDIVYFLYKMLKDDTVSVETLEYTALAMLNVTQSTRIIWRCREIWDLPLVLIRRAHNKENEKLQFHSIQTLRQITSMPSIKDFVRKTCKIRIVNIECRTEFVKKAKDNLLEWLRKKPYMNINKDPGTFDTTIYDKFYPGEDKPENICPSPSSSDHTCKSCELCCKIPQSSERSPCEPYSDDGF